MHILFLTDNFPPETNAPASRVHEHAKRWVAKGYEVTVVTCAPNFPQGKVHEGYKNSWYTREEVDGIHVVRVKTYISANKGFARRTLDFLSFMIMGLFAGLLQKRPDVVVATSPQFFCSVAGWGVAALKRKPFVFELRDLWPESIRAVSAVKHSLVISMFERLELFLYRRATAIVALTEAFRQNLVTRGIPGEKIAVVRNGVDLTRYAPRRPDWTLASEANVEGKFVVGYVGTHGLAHALDNVLEAAVLMRTRKDVVFLFAGDGAERQKLIEKAEARGIENVRFLPACPKDEITSVWSVCDVALVHLKDDPLFETVIPSKIFEAMGMALPILFAGPDGEAADIVRNSCAGLTVAAEDAQALADAVRALADEPVFLSELKSASRAAAHDHCRDMLAGMMLVVFENVVAGRSAGTLWQGPGGRAPELIEPSPDKSPSLIPVEARDVRSEI